MKHANALCWHLARHLVKLSNCNGIVSGESQQFEEVACLSRKMKAVFFFFWNTRQSRSEVGRMTIERSNKSINGQRRTWNLNTEKWTSLSCCGYSRESSREQVNPNKGKTHRGSPNTNRCVGEAVSIETSFFFFRLRSARDTQLHATETAYITLFFFVILHIYYSHCFWRPPDNS